MFLWGQSHGGLSICLWNLETWLSETGLFGVAHGVGCKMLISGILTQPKHASSHQKNAVPFWVLFGPLLKEKASIRGTQAWGVPQDSQCCNGKSRPGGTSVPWPEPGVLSPSFGYSCVSLLDKMRASLRPKAFVRQLLEFSNFFHLIHFYNSSQLVLRGISGIDFSTFSRDMKFPFKINVMTRVANM